jgi:hypothetical protein
MWWFRSFFLIPRFSDFPAPLIQQSFYILVALRGTTFDIQFQPIQFAQSITMTLIITSICVQIKKVFDYMLQLICISLNG